MTGPHGFARCRMSEVGKIDEGLVWGSILLFSAVYMIGWRQP